MARRRYYSRRVPSKVKRYVRNQSNDFTWYTFDGVVQITTTGNTPNAFRKGFTAAEFLNPVSANQTRAHIKYIEGVAAISWDARGNASAFPHGAIGALALSHLEQGQESTAASRDPLNDVFMRRYPFYQWTPIGGNPRSEAQAGAQTYVPLTLQSVNIRPGGCVYIHIGLQSYTSSSSSNEQVRLTVSWFARARIDYASAPVTGP